MCREAKELQKLKGLLFEEGDWFINQEQLDLTKKEFSCKLAYGCRCFDIPVNNTLKVWIPTQQQIQELIIKEKKIGFVDLINDFGVLVHNDLDKESCYYVYWNKFDSIDELWLAFYMKYKYYDLKEISLYWDFTTYEWKKRGDLTTPLNY
jgi:hypothetical protein